MAIPYLTEARFGDWEYGFARLGYRKTIHIQVTVLSCGLSLSKRQNQTHCLLLPHLEKETILSSTVPAGFSRSIPSGTVLTRKPRKKSGMNMSLIGMWTDTTKMVCSFLPLHQPVQQWLQLDHESAMKDLSFTTDQSTRETQTRFVMNETDAW